MARSRARYTVLVLACVLSVITFIDRVCISAAAPAIRQDLGLNAVEMGWVFSAFTFAYAAFEIPGGWLGDVLGPRKVLMRIVLWWSAFTMISGLAWSFSSLVLARFLFGVGEAGAYPNISRSFLKWFPTHERGSAHGAVFMSSRVGAAVAPPLVVLIIAWAGWRAAFWAFGFLGVVWSVFWWRWFRDDPALHPAVDREELAHIRGRRGAGGPSAHRLARSAASESRDYLLDVLLHRLRAVFLPDVAADVLQGGAWILEQPGGLAVERRAADGRCRHDGRGMADRPAGREPSA